MKKFTFYKDADDSQLFSFDAETWNDAREQCAAMLAVPVTRVHWMPDIAMPEAAVHEQEAGELARELWRRRIEPGNPEDQIAFLAKLMEMLTPLQLSSLRFGLDMTPNVLKDMRGFYKHPEDPGLTEEDHANWRYEHGWSDQQ